MNIQTRSGKSVNPLGIGTWGIGGAWESAPGNEAAEIEGLRYSISRALNHIDTGQVYGAWHTHDVIGQAIEGLSRADLYIGDKLWETNVAVGKVRPAVEEMLKRLGTDYIDLLCVHKPWEDFPWRKAVPQINELIDEGLVRQFGASNFNLAQLQETMGLSMHPIAVNHLHFNVLNKQEANPAMRDFCKKHGIQIVAYKPLERGAVLENEVVLAIAKARGATAAQVALAWLLHHEAWVIPRATEKDLIDQNIAAVELKLSPAEVKQLDSI